MAKDLLSLDGTDLLLLGLEAIRRHERAKAERAKRPRRRVTVTTRQIYDRNTQKIVTLQTTTCTLTED